MSGDSIKSQQESEHWDHLNNLFNEKVRRLDDKIEQTERYLVEKCIKIETQAAATERLLLMTQQAADKAVGIANEASKLRFESFNEFNTRITQMTATFFTIPAFEQFRISFDSFKADTNRKLDKREGESAGIKLTGSTIISGVMFIAALIGIIVTVFGLVVSRKGP